MSEERNNERNDESLPIRGKELVIKEFPKKYANTSPIGLMGFGMTTIMLSLSNVTAFKFNTAILGLGIFYGGIAQFVAGVYAIKSNNTFGGTAFCSYGAFWLSFVMINIFENRLKISKEIFNMGETKKSYNNHYGSSPNAIGSYLMVWFVFTGFMFVALIKKGSFALLGVFLFLAFCFLFLSIADYTEEKGIKITGGAFGLASGFLAFYLACAEVINDQFGCAMLPIGERGE